MGADSDNDWEPKPCAGLWDLFFSEEPDEIAVAKAICERCVHGVWCVDQALTAIAEGETGGVWAGMTIVELKETLGAADRNRARKAGHPSGPTDAVPGVRAEPGDELGDVRGSVPPGPDASPRA